MKKHKILYVHSSNELYGADRSLLRLVTGIDPNRYEPHVVITNDVQYTGALTTELTRRNVAYHETPLAVLRRQYFNGSGILVFLQRCLASSVHLSRYIRQHGFDLVHSNSLAVLSGAFAAKLANVPHVWHVREIITSPKWLNALFAQLVTHYASVAVAVSAPVRSNLINAQPTLATKVKVIYNGIDPSPFLQHSEQDANLVRQNWHLPLDGIVIGVTGRISRWKGQKYLLESITGLLKANPSVYLVCVGGDVPGDTSPRQELLNIVARENLSSQVHVHPFQSDISAVLKSFDLFVLPSIEPDPFPTVVLEAMASGLPVVATAHGGALEQLDDGTTGFLVKPDSTEAMASAVARLVQDVQLRRQLGEAGRSRLLTKFTIEKYIENNQNLYSAILGS